MKLGAGAEALELYRAGRVDAALDRAVAALERDPHSAHARLVQALVAFRRADAAATVEALKALQKLRSADWILASLRTDFATQGAPRISPDLATRVGGFLRAALPALSPPLAPSHRQARHAFVNVVGSSWVRSFGGNTAFFPLFIGMGPTTLLLSDQTAAVTQRKLEDNLRRCDPTRDTLIMLGSDAHYRSIDFLKDRGTQSRSPTPEDLAAMDAAAERHRPLLEQARKLMTGRVFLVGSTPMREDLAVQLAQRLNRGLRKVCAETGVTFLDWWDVLADPVTQHLKSGLGADAYPGDAHFRIETTELFIDLLKAEGVLPPETPATSDYDWTHVFECEVHPSERTRIWCEPAISPNNAIKSHKIAASHLGQRVADVVTLLAAERADPVIAMFNVRDAYLPIAVPGGVHAGCLAATGNGRDVEAGQMALDFWGRSDVTLRRQTPDLWREVGERAFDLIAIQIHPSDVAGDEARTQEALDHLAPAGAVLIATPAPERAGAFDLKGRRPIAQLDLSNRHLPEAWRRYALILAR
jgi:hypothetical protein